MGKRKKSSRKPMGPKRSDPLPSTFTCLFCNHEKSVTVKLDKKAGVGQLDCRICGQKFQCAVNYLSAAVDVYGEWVDAAGKFYASPDTLRRQPANYYAEAVAKGDDSGPGYAGTARSAGAKRTTGGRSGADYDDDDRRSYDGEGVVAGDDEY